MSSEYTGPTLPDDFGFQPGQLIPSAPYIFPDEQDLVYLLEMAGQYFGGWVEVIADIVVFILQLIDLLVSLFSGKPRAQDTIVVAKNFGRGHNPTAQIVATLIHRNLSQNDIVLSSSTAADQKILGHIRKLAEAQLVAQGADAARATKVIDEIWSSADQPGIRLPAELTQPLPQGLTLVGPTELQNIYTTRYNQAIQSGDDPAQAAKKATRALLENGKIGDIGKMTVQPLPQGGGGGGGGGGSQPPPPPPGCDPRVPPWVMLPCAFQQPPTPDDSLDEIGDLAQLSAWGSSVIAVAIMNVYQAILGLTPAGETQGDPVTCAQLTGLFGALTASIDAITAAIAQLTGAGGEGPLTFSPAITIQPAPVVIEPGTGTPVDLSHLNAQADSELDARTQTAATITQAIADVQALLNQFGVQA